MVNGKIIMPPAGDHWKLRAIRACKNDMLMECFLLAICGWQASFLPRFGRVAIINADGEVFTDTWDGYGKKTEADHIGPVQIIIDNFRRLADHLQLADDECEEMFSELKKWFVHDARANQSNEERGLLQ